MEPERSDSAPAHADEHEDQAPVDDAAPFGYDDNGKPVAPYGYTAKGAIKMDGRGRPTGKAARAPRAGRAPAAPKPKAPPRRPAGAKQNYTKTIETALHLVLAPAAMAPAIALDVAPFMEHSKNLAVAGNEVLQAYPAAAAYVAQVASKGPLMVLFGALLPPLAQVAANHNWLPPEVTSKFGAVSPAEYAARLQQRAAAMQAAATAHVPDQQVNGHAPAYA